MKIFSSKQIKDWDLATLKEDDISGTELMNRAAEKCFRWYWPRYSQKREIFIFCGKGNNGGDGLALGRLLLNKGYTVRIILTHPVSALSPESRWQWEQLPPRDLQSKPDSKSGTGKYLVMELADFSKGLLPIPPRAILIDALFGTGLKRPLEGTVADLVLSLNQLPNLTIAIDLPSGLAADQLPGKQAAVLQADHTLTLGINKHSLLHPEAARFAGRIHVLLIGLSQDYYLQQATAFWTLDQVMIREIFRPRDPFGHKGSFGTAVLVGGSYGKMGSIAMSAKAALRAGAGKVFVQAPKCGDIILQTYIPEAMFQSMGETFIEYIAPLEKAVFGIGPGLGQEQESLEALRTFLKEPSGSLVLDADALNLTSQDPDNLLPLIPQGTIITPHPKEYERLFGATENSLEQVKSAQENARKHELIIVLKGHHTAICLPDGRVYYNLTGNAGMGTAGSGDVLTGIITGLLAQKYSPEHAALLGVYLHGLAGDLAVKDLSKQALIAGDLLDYIGAAFRDLKRKPSKSGQA